MKSIILLVVYLLIANAGFSLKNVKDEGRRYTNITEIPKNKYFMADYMPADYRICYGSWKAVATSGGFNGKGFTLDFDHLIMKDNGIFALTKNDSLLAYGKMVLVNKDQKLNCKFVFDGKAKLELANDNEKYLILTHLDTLYLISPCCDRYNIKLAKEK